MTLQGELLRGGGWGLLFIAVAMVAWLASLAATIRRRREQAVQALEVMWLLALLSAANRLMCTLIVASTLGDGHDILILNLTGMAYAVTLPAVTAAIASAAIICMLMVAAPRKPLPPFHVTGGIVSGLGAVLLSYVTLVLTLTAHPL